ncbi:MAG: hypothetical protein U0936_18555 [Planctomycetaceae bacterium]
MADPTLHNMYFRDFDGFRRYSASSSNDGRHPAFFGVPVLLSSRKIRRLKPDVTAVQQPAPSPLFNVTGATA